MTARAVARLLLLAVAIATGQVVGLPSSDGGTIASAVEGDAEVFDDGGVDRPHLPPQTFADLATGRAFLSGVAGGATDGTALPPGPRPHALPPSWRSEKPIGDGLAPIPAYEADLLRRHRSADRFPTGPPGTVA